MTALATAIDLAASKAPDPRALRLYARLTIRSLREDGDRFGLPYADLPQRVAHGLREACGCSTRTAKRIADEALDAEDGGRQLEMLG